MANQENPTPSLEVQEAIWKQVIDTIEQNQTFLLTAHAQPDGDAVGSVLSLYGVLKHLGKDVFVFNDTEYPEPYRFLAFSDQMQTEIPADRSFDVSILCDCGEVARAPEGFGLPKERQGTLIVLDHHLTSVCQGDINLNLPKEPAAAMLVYKLAKRLNIPISREIAINIYAALSTDTGNFRYQSTTPNTFRVAAELLEAGVDPWEVASEIYETNPPERQKLLALALNTIDIFYDGKLAFLTLTDEMYQQTGGHPEMTDGFINFARGIRGVEVAVLFRQEGPAWKLSFRSRGAVNVSAIAGQFGGGGHHNAAGVKLMGQLQTIKEDIHQAMIKVLQETT